MKRMPTQRSSLRPRLASIPSEISYEKQRSVPCLLLERGTSSRGPAVSDASIPARQRELTPGGAPGLPSVGLWCVMLVFGAVTLHMISRTDEPGAARLDVLLFASGVGCLAASLCWFFVVALQRSLIWSLIMVIPLVNTLALPLFARAYWSQGARAPTLLAMVGIAGELVGSLRLMLSSGPQLV